MTVGTSNHMSNDWMTLNNESERVWKEMAAA
jgi:hypothetical protein